MFEKKNTYAQGEMRPLSALSKGGSKPQPKKAVPVQTPASPDMQSTVSTLSEQNKITDTATVQRTPLREAARQAEEKNAAIPEHPSMHVPPKSGSQSPDLSTKEARDAYFSKYLSRIDAPRKAAVRTVVSHVKETPAEPPVQETQKTMYEEELTLEAPPQMTEAIENAAQAIRQEREARQASSLPKPEREKNGKYYGYGAHCFVGRTACAVRYIPAVWSAYEKCTGTVGSDGSEWLLSVCGGILL